jgi:hypothetical protein
VVVVGCEYHAVNGQWSVARSAVMFAANWPLTTTTAVSCEQEPTSSYLVFTLPTSYHCRDENLV